MFLVFLRAADLQDEFRAQTDQPRGLPGVGRHVLRTRCHYIVARLNRPAANCLGVDSLQDNPAQASTPRVSRRHSQDWPPSRGARATGSAAHGVHPQPEFSLLHPEDGNRSEGATAAASGSCGDPRVAVADAMEDFTAHPIQTSPQKTWRFLDVGVLGM